MSSLKIENTECIKDYLQDQKEFIETALLRALNIDNDDRLKDLREAVKYALFSGGKRLRPILTLAVTEMYECPVEQALDCACAIEMLHCSSLIIDDLPSMDNSSLRRGRLSCHKKFGEATAILASLALASKAFECITNSALKGFIAPDSAIEMLNEIAGSIGISGAVGGQYVDLFNQNELPQMPEFVCERKTGALFSAACITGARISNASDAEIKALESYGKHLGQAYQIRDDILDITGDPEKLGKETLQDTKNNRLTFVKQYGLEKCKKLLKDEIFSAVESLSLFGDRAWRLRQIAQFAEHRAF